MIVQRAIMIKLKKVLIVIMILLTLQLNIPGTTVADQAAEYAMTETDAHAPESQVVLEKDLPEKEQSWFSKYKWWIIGGLVLIAGGVAAAVGGGSDDGGDPPPTPTGVKVRW
jgi:hypothetical protein